MIETAIRVKADLDKGIRKTFLDTLFVTKDKAAHRFEIEVVRGDAPVTLSGTVSAYFIRYCDNLTIPMDGTLSGNVANVTLAESCYERNTQFALIVKVSSGSEVGTVFYGEGTMLVGETDAFIDEDKVVPSLNDLLAQIDAMEKATENATEAAYLANTAAVSANEAASHSPFIGSNGNWFVWDNGVMIDTGRPAQGPQGEQGPSGTMTGTVESAAKLDGKTLADIMLEIYPVGSIYTSTSATDPAEIFGGKWMQLEDRFLIGASDTYKAGTVGGSATKTLTVNQMPEHTHGFGYAQYSVAAGEDFARLDSQHTLTSNALNKSAGKGEPFDIMPPYLPVYMWERVS